MKDIEISTLRMQNEQLQNELKREKEIAESFNKSSEAIKHFEQLLKLPRSNNDTSGLGFTSTEEGESSKSVEERSDKAKNPKPNCHFCGKKGHKYNVCKSKNVNQHDKSKNMGHYHKCNKKGHQEHDCKARTIRTSKFEGYCYNCQKYGHRAFECRSKPMWSPNKPTKVGSHGHHYNWD